MRAQFNFKSNEKNMLGPGLLTSLPSLQNAQPHLSPITSLTRPALPCPHLHPKGIPEHSGRSGTPDSHHSLKEEKTTTSPTFPSPTQQSPSPSSPSILSLELRSLVKLQECLDSHLAFLGEHRRKQGEFLGQVRESLRKNHVLLDLNKLKQILYLWEECYQTSRQKNRKHQWDLYLRIPVGCLIQRRRAFRARAEEWFTRHGQARIPLYQFSFEMEIEFANAKTRRVQEEAKIEERARKERNPFSMKQLFNRPQGFQEALSSQLREKERQCDEQKRMREEERKKWGRAELTGTIHAVQKAFLSGKLIRVPRETLLQRLDEELRVSRAGIEWALGRIEELAGGYLRSHNTTKGVVLEAQAPQFGMALRLLEGEYPQ